MRKSTILFFLVWAAFGGFLTLTPAMAKKKKNTSKKDAPHTRCSICSKLNDDEWGFQKYGWEEDNTYLPAAAGKLEVLKDFKPYSSRKLQLWQCPTCHTYYLYETDYEFLVNGSEDEEHLKRLTDEEAARYLEKEV